MTRMLALGMLTLLATTTFALAQDKKPAKPGEGAPAMEPPKPPPELDALKAFAGSWKCDEKAPESPMGPAHDFKARLTIKKTDLDFWYMGRFEELKSKTHPINYKADDYWSYDAGNKKWMRVWVDNMGGWASFTAPGWEGDKIVWTGEGLMMGKKTGIRHSITKKSDKEFDDTFEMNMGGKWVTVGSGTCKK